MRQDKNPATCYCIVPNQSQSSMLVRRVQEGYECPNVLLPWMRLKFFPDHIPLIRQELCRTTNLDVTVLRHLRDTEDVQMCLIEVQSVIGNLPDGYQWLDNCEEAEWANEQSFQAWQEWRFVSQVSGNFPAAAPWERHGWFTDAKVWIEANLLQLGYLASSVNQVKGAWGWSTILKAETDKGDVYFKADYNKPPKEVAVIQKLAEQWSQNVPHIIAADVERSWMLLSDFGASSLEDLGTNQYSRAVSLFANIQCSTALDKSEWELLGCLDMTPDNLLRLTRQLLDDTAVLCGGTGGLRPEELAEIERKLPQIEQMLLNLSSSALPNTISNEDFRAGNAVVQDGRYVFYDWSSTVISHPLFGINYFLNRMLRSDTEDRSRWKNDLEDEKRRAVLTAYLSQWTDYAAEEQIISEFWLCRRLYPLYEAVKYYCDLPFVDTSSPWGAGTLASIPHVVRNLIDTIDYQPVTR